ncbi:DNA repair protein XRCC4, partial [Mucuna pruriens]
MERYSCSKLLIPNNDSANGGEPIFVKATWFPTHFHLAITDGQTAWHCHPSEEEVNQRAAQWDLPVSEYLHLSERYLALQQPRSLYAFDDAGDGHKRLSWTFEREGMTLLWRWKCMHSPDSKQSNVQILDFLMSSNINLSLDMFIYMHVQDKVVRENELFEKMKVEAEKCLMQSERIANERVEFESEIYAKFLGVLNSKKSKLRELRDKLSKQENSEKSPQEEDTDKTESFDEESDEEPQKDISSSSKGVMANKPSRLCISQLLCGMSNVYILHRLLICMRKPLHATAN